MPMCAGAVGVTVNHLAHAARLEGRNDGGGCDIHDVICGDSGVRLAAGAGGICEQLPGFDGQLEDAVTETRVAHRAAQFLISMIAGAEQITMGQQNPLIAERRDDRIGQQRRAATLLEDRAIQKITIPLHHVERGPRVGERAQIAADEVTRRIGIIITDPGFEEIAEDMQRGRAASGSGEKMQESIDRRRGCGIEMQVGDKQVTHAGILAVKCHGSVTTASF